MEFPAQLEIRTRDRPVNAVVRPPGSKSITNRALVAAALATGVTRLSDPLDADDTDAMRSGLVALGTSIDDSDDPWLILGTGGELSLPVAPIDARFSGTTARFLTAVAALVPGIVTITGQGRMLQRPMNELLQGLEAAGVTTRAAAGRLPVTVMGKGVIGGGVIPIDPSRSSQFVSALLLIAPMAREAVQLNLTAPPVSLPYLTSTLEVMREFGARVVTAGDSFDVEPTGYQSARFKVEADASAAAYPLVAAAITAGVVGVEGIPENSTQADLALVGVLEAMGCVVKRTSHRVDLTGPERLDPVDVDMNHAPDAALALAVACLFATGQSRIGNLGNLRLKETDRLEALRAEINRLGGFAAIEGNDLIVGPGKLRPATIQTYDDHRMAMAFALVGLRQKGVVINQPGCVEKTWPLYFEMLARL